MQSRGGDAQNGSFTYGVVPLVTLDTKYILSGRGTSSDPWKMEEGLTPEDFSGKPLIMEWNVPGNSTIKLPIEANTKNLFIVNWGDTTDTWETFDGSVNFPTHTYTSAKTYTITVYGNLYSFGYLNYEVPTASGTYSNYYTFTQYLTKLVQWGELGVEGNYVSQGNASNRPSYGFSNCINLTGEIPLPTTSLEKAVTAEAMFRNCGKITGSIPPTLFSGAGNIKSFENTFAGSGFSGLIPKTVFAYSTQANNFFRTFYACTKLTGGEIDINTTRVTTSEGMFQQCSNLESLVFFGDFKKLNGVNMFANSEKLIAIILLAVPSSQSDVSNNYAITTTAQIPSNAKIYVVDEDVEKYFEGAWASVFGAGIATTEKIRTIVEPVGDNPTRTKISETYTDKGYTVAGYNTTTQAEKYTQYGFYVEVEIPTGITNTIGTKKVTYQLYKE